PITPAVGVKPATPPKGIEAPKATAIGVAVQLPVSTTSRLTPAAGVVRIPRAEPSVPSDRDTLDDDAVAILATPTGGVPAPMLKPTSLGVSPLARSPKSDHPKATRIGFPAIKLPAMEAPAVIVATPPRDADPPPNASPFMRATPPQPMVAVVPPKPSGPPMPRQPTPFAPLPIVRLPAASDAILDPEKTDLTDIPASDEPRSLGVAIVTAVVPEASEPTRQEPPLSPSEIAAAEQSGPPSRSGGMRASELLAAIGGEDWTMSPDEEAPKVLPAVTVETMDSVRPTEEMGALARPTPDPDIADNWTMTADPSAAGGWSEPSKVDIPPMPPPKGNRLVDVASAAPINAVEWEDKPTGIGEPLVEIDPSLLPTTTMTRAPTPPPIPALGSRPPAIPPPLGPMPPQLQPAMSSFGPTGPVQPIARASSQVPVFDGDPLALYGGPRPPDPMESTSLLTPPKSKRGIIIALVAIGVALAGTAIAVFGFGVGRSKPSTQPIAVTPPPVPAPAPEPAPTPTPAPTAPPAPPAIAACKVDVQSSPDGAEIWLADAQLGITPTTLSLPCGVEAKLSLKHGRATLVRSITPAADTPPLVVRFAVPPTPAATVMMRVTSTPPGATITIAGRVVGVTPTMIHVPASGASLTLSKDGFSSDTEHVAAKPNGTLGFVLKHAPARQRNH
ncbi:MAG TPA: PEGA domain-containing protein, partial [Kofleriaceae bacterium]